MTSRRKPILCLDFDGVIHSYTSRWKGARVIPDPPVPGALEFLVAAQDSFRVSIFSSRSHQWGGRRAMKRWLRSHIADALMAHDAKITYPRLCELAGDLQAMTWEDWYDTADAAARKIVNLIDFPKHKPPASVSIDDRCLTFTGEWPHVADLETFKPWNKA